MKFWIYFSWKVKQLVRQLESIISQGYWLSKKSLKRLSERHEFSELKSKDTFFKWHRNTLLKAIAYFQISNVENLSPQIIRQVLKELQKIAEEPLEGIKIQVNDADVTDIQALIDGPAGTPYTGGVFRIKLALGKDFPQSPPKAFFLTKIFHPNVAPSGEICVNTLKRDWKPDLGIKHILLTIKCLLIVPNPESALNEEAGKLLLEHYDDYSQRAKMMTEIHAQVNWILDY